MGGLTTHVLDTAHGCPAAGVTWRLYRLNEEATLVTEGVTNRDGRVDQPILQGDALVAGRYRLEFEAGAYFRSCNVELPNPPFVDQVLIQFGIADTDAHYHVPLLVSPWSYSTYRGS